MFQDFASRLLRRDWRLGTQYLNALKDRRGEVGREDVNLLARAIEGMGEGLREAIEEIASMQREESPVTHRNTFNLLVTHPTTVPRIPYAGTTNDLAAHRVIAAGSSFTGDSGTGVTRGYAYIGEGVSRFDKLAVVGNLLVGGNVNLAGGQIQVNGQAAGVRKIRFTLLDAIDTAGDNTASATVNEYLGGSDPGATVTVVNTAENQVGLTGDEGWAFERPDGTWEISDLLGSVHSGLSITVLDGVTYSTAACEHLAQSGGDTVTRICTSVVSLTPQFRCVTVDRYGRVLTDVDGACP